MSSIELFRETYLSLPKLLFLNERMELTDISNPMLPFPAVYDPDLGKGDERYVSGMFPDYQGGTYHSDSQYDGKLSYLLAHEHGMFGYMPVLRRLNKFTHWHYIHIVSTTSTQPQEVMHVMESGDIKFNATIHQFPPAITLYPDEFGNDHMLIEITPHLPNEDLARVASDVNAVKTYVQKMAETETRFYDMKAKKEVQQAQLIGVQSQLIFTQHKYKQLLGEFSILYDEFDNLSLENAKKLKLKIMDKEMENNLGLPYTFHNQIDVTHEMARMRQNILDLQAQAQLEGGNEAIKDAVFSYALSVIGIDELKKRLFGTEAHIATSPTGGLETIYMPKIPSLEELRRRKIEEAVRAGVPESKLEEVVKAQLAKERETIKSKEINSAREDLKREALRLEDYGERASG